ncbi:MAG: hypothetical protein WCX22_12000, partial [Methanoregula sp.]
IGSEDNNLMPAGGTGFNEVRRLVNPFSSFRDNPRLSTMSDLHSVHLFFLTRLSTDQGTEKKENY